MNVLITGGAGFIGANLLNDLVPLHPEHHFVNVDVLTYAGSPLSLKSLEEAPNYAFEQVDIADQDALGRVFDRWEPEMVLNLAAETHVDRSIREPRPFLRSNVEGTFNLLEQCRRRWTKGQGRFHQVSTDEVYGSLGSVGRFTEASALLPSSPYAATKAAADHLALAWHHTYGLPVTVTRCSNNFGPFQFPEKLIPLMILRALEGQALPIYGTGHNVRDWIFVGDHVEAIWRVAVRGQPGSVYALGGDCERTNLQVVDAILRVLAEETGRDLESMRSLVSFVPDRLGHDLRYSVDFSRIRADLGWAPRETFTAGLVKTVRWYLANLDWVRRTRAAQREGAPPLSRPS